ncbi:hypothetical protein ASG11_12740 [Sphingomonas sp. Leaf357]|uniref:S9 family peptidase n=1 Tax=Sphingomonas sp. Leaf357 TaxID=1736350 RepID=UPI0006F6E6B3|nr:prolyl oligopeptidase family serine peptidase [Sphingomonas sp. Leaf357]KQS05008.1 hypothetical protein ASG11_12740 [Sphingomonas sp. Leaf357]
MAMSAHDTVTRIYARLMRAGSGKPYDATDLCTPDGGRTMFFIGKVCGADVTETPRSVVYRDDRSGDLVSLHDGPAKLLTLSAISGRLAFAVSNADGADRLVVMASDGSVEDEFCTLGRLEQIDWSPDDTALLLLVAGPGTDTTTLAGSVSVGRHDTASSWDPVIDDGAPDPDDWRHLSIYRPSKGAPATSLPVPGMVWEASWCGDTAIVVLRSDRSGEAAWYRASLAMLDLTSLKLRPLLEPADQIGHVRGAPDGRSVVFVEGVASDRGIVCGSLKRIDACGGAVDWLDTGRAEITSVAWRGHSLHLAGQRGLTTVIADHDLTPAGYAELWSADDWSCGAQFPTSRPSGAAGAVAVLESQTSAPRLAAIGVDGIEVIRVLADGNDRGDGVMTTVRWPAPDGSEIEGLLVRPVGAAGPLPTVVEIHGGPVWAFRARWEGRQRAAPALIANGVAMFYPNPRGSSGRGQDFARAVLGDMGGADAGDIIAGIEYLIAQRLADPERIGLTGSSYGGYMSALLPKLMPQIAAAVCISPVSNWFSQHFTSNMPILEDLFLGGRPATLSNTYVGRSPALSAAKTQAATLILAGALDRCTPIGQSIELHRSLLEQGSSSMLMTYPMDGHSLRGPRSYIDSAARVLDWFTRHMSA